MKKMVFLLVSATFLTSCATTDDRTEQAPREQKTFVTGSNLPQRDKKMNSVTVVGSQALEDAALNEKTPFPSTK